jgi:hypothetical protein
MSGLVFLCTPWGLCLGMCLSGSFGLHLAHARLMLGASVFVFLCIFLCFYCLQASNANTHRHCARSRSRSPRSIPGVCVWACVWVEASACTWLMLGSCSGLRLAPCLCVSLYFLEVLCLGLCLGFKSGLVFLCTPWGLCLGLCLGGSFGLHSAHARLMLGASEFFPVF